MWTISGTSTKNRDVAQFPDKVLSAVIGLFLSKLISFKSFRLYLKFNFDLIAVVLTRYQGIPPSILGDSIKTSIGGICGELNYERKQKPKQKKVKGNSKNKNSRKRDLPRTKL